MAFLKFFLVSGAGHIQTWQTVYRVKRTGWLRLVRQLGAKLCLDALNISLSNCCRVRQVPLLLRSLLRQNVTFEGVLSLDLSTSRKFKTLLGASFGFHLRHGLGFYDWLFFLRIE